MEWADAYPKSRKPAYQELLDFLPPYIRELFLQFDGEMNRQYKVHNKYHRYSLAVGWTYGYGRSYGCELLTVMIKSDGFHLLGLFVKDDDTLQNALAAAKREYDSGFEERYAAISAKRRADQSQRSKKRVTQEKIELAKLSEHVDPGKLNQFKWRKKVSRSDLHKLYQGEAMGLLDEALLEDIGLTFYLRCKEAKDVRACMDKGQIICHHCGAVLTGGRVSPTGSVLMKNADNYTPIHCQCGYAYTYREYRRSCNAANMPGGRATPVFDGYVQKWPGCRNARDKMLLIDRLIHQCHVTLMSGEKGRSVCVNLIEGTLKQIADLIVKLAYGNEGGARP